MATAYGDVVERELVDLSIVTSAPLSQPAGTSSSSPQLSPSWRDSSCPSG